jgi:hypothetical protein
MGKEGEEDEIQKAWEEKQKKKGKRKRKWVVWLRVLLLPTTSRHSL